MLFSQAIFCSIIFALLIAYLCMKTLVNDFCLEDDIKVCFSIFFFAGAFITVFFFLLIFV